MTNLIYLHSHDTGRWIEPLGYPCPTPSFSRLASEGVLFEDAHTPSPTCSPSRACLLTGRGPRANGMIGLAHRGARLRDPSQHLAAVLERNGYHTALAGVQHEFDDRSQPLPYRERLARADTASVTEQDMRVAESAAAFLGRAHDRPFFLSCGFFSTHRSPGRTMQWFNAEDSPLGDPASVQVPPGLPDVPAVRQDLADFNQSLQRLDRCVGVVLDALDASGLRDNTLVICTTDHGPPYPGYKCRLTTGGTGVLLILRGGPFCGGRRIDAMVTQLDVFPTVCEVLGMDPPAGLEGRSLRPLATGEINALHETLYAEVNYHAAYEPMRAVRDRNHVLVHRFGKGSLTPVLPNCDPGPSRQAMIDNDWHRQPEPRRALYRADDHVGRENLIDLPEYAPVAQRLEKVMAERMRTSQDPLAQDDDVPAWPGMKITPASALYPSDPQVSAGRSSTC